ncbi:hypothetical protein ZOSMA_24G00970 [Zostera marina]|uniref:Uncharacterized protein n=1 Tax=Zostera marina TaxID=29655 RepID=A0A0K9PGH0_ZOSMR|nr:hypothetical protein ZOSMA_24G00970 [Zostera marina]
MSSNLEEIVVDTLSSSSDSPPKISEKAENIAKTVTSKLDELDMVKIRNNRPNICKIPDDIRSGAPNGVYNPKIMSIGPFHQAANNPSLKYMEEIKLLYLHDLLARDPDFNQVKYYANMILKHEDDARREYSERIKLESKEFVEILLIDGCFLVEFLLKRAEGKVGKPLTGQLRNMPMLRHDLLLLENQIPFFILQTILDESNYDFGGSDGIHLLDLALHYLYKGKVKKEMLPQKHQDGTKVYHLLHLSYLCMLQGMTPMTLKVERMPETRIGYVGKKAKDFLLFPTKGGLILDICRKIRSWFSYTFIFILYVVFSLFMILIELRLPGWSTSNKKLVKKPRVLPTAEELKEAGVLFIKKDNSRSYMDVSFDKANGTIEIPLVHIQENSNSEFRNFLALEQCCPDVGNNFTSYVVFMDNMINGWKDVSLLRRSGIIESKLGCDQDVATFFNGLRTGLCFNFDRHYLASMFEDITNYYNQDCNRWRAELMHYCFTKPTSILILNGFLLLLALVIVQTIYTVKL